MFKEIVSACGTEVPLVEVNSTGSMENVNNLVGNQVNAAFVQSDVLYLRARTEELGNVKTLLALNSEQVHIVTRAASGLKTGGVMGVGGSAVTFTDLSSLAGYKVGGCGRRVGSDGPGDAPACISLEMSRRRRRSASIEMLGVMPEGERDG